MIREGGSEESKVLPWVLPYWVKCPGNCDLSMVDPDYESWQISVNEHSGISYSGQHKDGPPLRPCLVVHVNCTINDLCVLFFVYLFTSLVERFSFLLHLISGRISLPETKTHLGYLVRRGVRLSRWGREAFLLGPLWETTESVSRPLQRIFRL